MSVIHRLQQEPPLGRFFAQKNVVAVDPRLLWRDARRMGVAVAIQGPGVKDNETIDILRVEQFRELGLVAAPHVA